MSKKNSTRTRENTLWVPSTGLNSVNEESETVKIIQKQDGQKPELIQIETNDTATVHPHSSRPNELNDRNGYQLPKTN